MINYKTWSRNRKRIKKRRKDGNWKIRLRSNQPKKKTMNRLRAAAPPHPLVGWKSGAFILNILDLAGLQTSTESVVKIGFTKDLQVIWKDQACPQSNKKANQKGSYPMLPHEWLNMNVYSLCDIHNLQGNPTCNKNHLHNINRINAKIIKVRD